jgi:4-carboxymuconolactone decarboxylase
MYLPEIFKTFVERHKDVSEALRNVGEICAHAGPLDAKTLHLAQMGVSLGLGSKGGVRSHARRAIEAGATREEITQVVLAATTIIGFPAMIAAYGWIEELSSSKE